MSVTQRIEMGASRDAGVETLRGLAVLLMVAGHVIGNDASHGLRVPDDSGWRYAYFSLTPMRLPLFTAISGFVYAFRPVAAGRWATFMRGKLRRLFVPFLVVGGAFILVQSIAPGVRTRPALGALPTLLIFPYAHFWYLYALAWVFALVGTLDALGLLDGVGGWALAVASSFALWASGLASTDLLGIGDATFLLPYFLLGLGVRRFGVPGGRPLALAWLGLGAVGLLLHQGGWFGWWRLGGPWSHVGSSLVGTATVVALLTYRVAWAPLAAVGTCSYGIYLMHIFGTAGSRVLLGRAGVTSLGALALAGVVAGIALPMALEKAVGDRPWPALLLLGRRVRSRPGPAASSAVATSAIASPPGATS